MVKITVIAFQAFLFNVLDCITIKKSSNHRLNTIAIYLRRYYGTGHHKFFNIFVLFSFFPIFELNISFPLYLNDVRSKVSRAIIF